jgi:hypothetical protein
MLPSGTVRRVALASINVSEEPIAFIVRVTRINELGMLAVTSNRSTLQIYTMIVTLMMSHYIAEDMRNSTGKTMKDIAF